MPNWVGMNVDEIRHRLSSGFKPFRMFLSDGRQYDVPHPEFILVTRRSVAVADPEGFIDTLDPLHIVSLKDVAAVGAGTMLPSA
jgi:hypothetical protein